MKIKLLAISLLVSTTLTISQNQVQKINREDFIGQKIKFLPKSNDAMGYYNMGKTTNRTEDLSDSDLKGKIATFIEKDDKNFTLKLNVTGELIYYRLQDFSKIPKTIGFFSLLDSARTKYLNKTFYDADFNECKITRIDFAESEKENKSVDGPYSIFYKVGKDTLLTNLYFTETYFSPIKSFVKEYDKEAVFENVFKTENPFKALTKSNIGEKFFIENDDIENKKTYTHINFANKDYIKNINAYAVDNNSTALISRLVMKAGVPRILFYSNYCDNDWIFHSYVKVKIGDISKQTTPTKGIREVFDGGKVHEKNYYSLPTDLAILKWIADNYKSEIKVRFYGKDYYRDIVISMPEKLAIKETFDLYNLLMKK